VTETKLIRDKRLQHRSSVAQPNLLKVHHKGQRVLGYAVNLSRGGALIHCEGLNVKRNSAIDIVFVVQLNKGKLARLYFKEAIVCHVTNGNIGVVLGDKIRRR
jgi:hypothetical protein